MIPKSRLSEGATSTLFSEPPLKRNGGFFPTPTPNKKIRIGDLKIKEEIKEKVFGY